MMAKWLMIPAFLIATLISQIGLSRSYSSYKVDWYPLHSNKKAHAKWQKLTDQYKAKGMDKANIEARLKVMRPLVKKHPKWADGYWILANIYMQMGETVSAGDEKSAKIARGYLVKAQKNAEKCLKLKPNLAICKFFLGASIGKIGTIDGIFASLGKGRKVLDLWTEVYESDQEYVFEDGYSLQGLVRYALGIFYRVVPDIFLLRWIFGFSGDIDKSIQMHGETLNFVGGNGPCNQLMYAVAMLCKTKGDKDEALTKKAFTVLDRVAKFQTQDESGMVCIGDAPRLKKKPKNACGYTKAKQQETDESKMKAQMKKAK